MPSTDPTSTPSTLSALAARPPLASGRVEPILGEAPPAANDDTAEAALDEQLLRAALRLTGERGSAAARFAHASAEQAYFAGGGAPYRWWLELTRVLDRMLAAEFCAQPAGERLPQA